MSAAGALETASQVLSTGIIIAIVVGSVIGLGILICIIVILYCLCCRKKKTYPGAVIQTSAYPGADYYNQPTNKV